jgi:ABC-2 type transport system ATP-binding protein
MENLLPHPAQQFAEKYRKNIEAHVREDQLNEALNELQDFASNLAPSLRDNVIRLRRRYTQFKNEEIMGIANFSEADAITKSLLQLLTQGEKQIELGPAYATLTVAPVNHNPSTKKLFPLKVVPTYEAGTATAISMHHGSNTADGLDGGTSGHNDTLEKIQRDFWRQYRSNKPPDDTNVFCCENITKKYNANNFNLQPISFTLRVGEITGIVGRNASGKTTLLQIVRGELVQDDGKTSYPLLTRDDDSWPHIKQQIGYIPQFPPAWAGTVRTNLNFIAAAYGSKGKKNSDLVEWHIQRYGLMDYQHARWKELSGGFRMRYELVRSLISRPRILILDEPLASLDVLARHEFLKNLRTIAYSLELPVPVLVTSQHLYEIEAIADKLIVLDNGKSLFCDDVNRLEADSPVRLYEITTKASKAWLLENVDSYEMKILETTVDGYIIAFSKQHPTEILQKYVQEKLGSHITGFRDITGSARRFFVDALSTQGKRVRT